MFRGCIKKLKFTYDYSTFRNPALQKLWYHIESIALDLENPEEVEDLTMPNIARLEERVGKENGILTKFAQNFDLNEDISKAKRKVIKN